MADGGQTVDQWDLVERAARRLAHAFGTGYGWRPDVREATRSGGATTLPPQSPALAISRRGQVTEHAARSIGGTRHLRRQQEWSKSRGVVAVPSYRQDSDAIAALSFAKLEGPLEAILLLYATGDVSRYWPTVKRFGLAGNPFWQDDCALTDAMQRILCGRAAMSQDARAKELRMRASSYRELTRSYERRLGKWLASAAGHFLTAMGSR
jgi:hypothetical protein